MSVTVIFVCWGNICRSTMGEQIARSWFADQGLDVLVDSAGVSSEERGNPIDPRAARALAGHGYPVGAHRAQRITAEMIAGADLVLGFEEVHLARMRRLAPSADNLRLVTDFDPNAQPGSGINDPWYGTPRDFEETLRAIEAAMPGIVEATRQLV